MKKFIKFLFWLVVAAIIGFALYRFSTSTFFKSNMEKYQEKQQIAELKEEDASKKAVERDNQEKENAKLDALTLAVQTSTEIKESLTSDPFEYTGPRTTLNYLGPVVDESGTTGKNTVQYLYSYDYITGLKIKNISVNTDYSDYKTVISLSKNSLSYYGPYFLDQQIYDRQTSGLKKLFGSEIDANASNGNREGATEYITNYLQSKYLEWLQQQDSVDSEGNTFTFVQKKVKVYDASEGYSLSVDGNIINPNGKSISLEGNFDFVNEDGNIYRVLLRAYNEEGYSIDGNTYSPEGNLITEEGNLVDVQAKFVDEKGNVIDKQGNLVYQEEKSSTKNKLDRAFRILLVGYAQHVNNLAPEKFSYDKFKIEIS